MIAVVPVRAGTLPLGADEAVAEAGGRAILVGEDPKAAAAELRGATEAVTCLEAGSYAAGAWAAALAPKLEAEDAVILPASPDGRDLAPRLAFVLGRPLFAGAVRITERSVVVVRQGGLVAEQHERTAPIVATLVPGVRGVDTAAHAGVHGAEVGTAADLTVSRWGDAEVIEVLPPDPETVDLAEAHRIVAGGMGLGGPGPFHLLKEVATALGASSGASRVAADLGWAPADRFIGTTGVTVNPRLYIALGISGAVQHVTGIGDPVHIIAVNVDASAPMMGLADLAIVTDAPALLVELADRLGVPHE